MARDGWNTTTGQAATAASAPAAAYILSLLAGVLVVLNGLLVISVGRTLNVAVFEWGAILGVAGVILGGAMLLAASRLNARPAEHVAWGAAMIVLSAVSLVLTGGGFIIGSVLGLVGGILAIAWKG